MKVNKNVENLRNMDSVGHLRGESIYVDDVAIKEGTLFAAVIQSPKAHGKIKSINFDRALAMEGVRRIITYKDVPGRNQIGGIVQDQPLFAEDEVNWMGQPIGLVLADNDKIAHLALDQIEFDIEELEVITDARDSFAKGNLKVPSRKFICGDPDFVMKACKYVVEGSGEINGQEHLYLETHGAYAWPLENGDIKVRAGSQGATHVQNAVTKVTGLPMHKIEVEINRIGGGFGGKEVQGDWFAGMASVATVVTHKPVKLVLHRDEDMRITGKRHPYDFDYKIGYDENFMIKAYDVTFFQNGGAYADISPAVMEITLFHGTSSYSVANARITVHSLRTNLPPNTAFRGFGAPQAMFAFEAALYKTADMYNLDFSELQKKNLLKEGDMFPFGQVAENVNATNCFNELEKTFELEKVKKEVAEFNKTHKTHKKGVATFPLCFGISFTTTGLNNGRSLVHVYADGSVGISTGVIEMGQGVNTKIAQVAATTFSISPEKVHVIPTNTTRVANAAPTAASTGADLNGRATEIACLAIVRRIKEYVAKKLHTQVEKVTLKDECFYVDHELTDLKWTTIVAECVFNRVNLSESGHYATPMIYFDKQREKGRAFAYHVFGTAYTVVDIDCILGTYKIEKARIVHDFGTSINEHLDIGQVEGAYVQGCGLVTNEELVFDPKTGRMISKSLATYKVPDIQFAPRDIKVKPLETIPAELAIFGSKAVGEPPLIYGFSAYFALQEALKAFNKDRTLKIKSPMTHKRCLEGLYDNFKG